MVQPIGGPELVLAITAALLNEGYRIAEEPWAEPDDEYASEEPLVETA